MCEIFCCLFKNLVFFVCAFTVYLEIYCQLTGTVMFMIVDDDVM